MSLYWPVEPAAADPTPRLHAFVAGVGDYTHLGAEAARPARLLNGLARLTTTPRAAKAIARWLEKEYRNDSCPLGSIELLLAPAETLERADGSTVEIEEATMANLAGAFNRWFGRCNASRDSIAFFYFAGHGIRDVRQFLLAGDFGNPDLPNEWENCIDFTGLKAGMGRCAAQTQVFFIDACRDTPINVLLQSNPNGRPLVTAALQDRAETSAAYYAAAEGRRAYGPDDAETYFCQALLACLRGAAARRSNATWRVDTSFLSSALSTVLANMALAYDLPLTSDCQIQKPAVLHYPAEGAALLRVSCRPQAVEREASIRVTQDGFVLNSPVGEPRPLLRAVKTGASKLEVRFFNYPEEQRSETVMPPIWEVDVER